MALFGQISAIAENVGSGIQLADSLFQNQLSIQGPDDRIYLNVTESEDINFSVNITEHPVADLGGMQDYISRNTTPLILNGTISNRNIDLRQNPLMFAQAAAVGVAPEIAGAIAAGVSFASNNFDLGQDEIIRKLQVLNRWMLNAEKITVLGMKLDARKITLKGEDFVYLINSVHPTYSTETGDCVSVQISLLNVLFIQSINKGKYGSIIKNTVAGSPKDGFTNPFPVTSQSI